VGLERRAKIHPVTTALAASLLALGLGRPEPAEPAEILRRLLLPSPARRGDGLDTGAFATCP